MKPVSYLTYNIWLVIKFFLKLAVILVLFLPVIVYCFIAMLLFLVFKATLSLAGWDWPAQIVDRSFWAIEKLVEGFREL